MKDRPPKNRPGRGEASSLSPGDAALLQAQVARLAQALEAGESLEAVRDLVAARPDDTAWDLELLRELERMPHPSVPHLLAALFAGSPDKARQKALRRALHVLKSRGATVPDDLLPREEAKALALMGALTFQGHISPVMGNGESFVFLEGPRGVLEGNFLVVRLSDQTGFVECHLLNLSRRQKGEVWEEFQEDGLGSMAPAPPAYALQLLEEGLALTPDGAPARGDYLPLREPLWRHLGRPQEALRPEDILGPLSPAERSRILEESRRLAGDILFRSWVPSLEDITPWMEKLKEVQASPLVLTEQQQRLRAEGVVDQAAAALFPAASRALWGRRFLKMAAYFHFLGRNEDAQEARVAGEDLLAEQRGPLAGENPFLLELVRFALILAGEVHRQQEDKSPASSLLLPATTPLISR